VSDEEYMRLALQLAARGKGRTSPNPMVGCVIVKDGVIAAQGYHEQAGGPHAEVVALRAAGDKARGASLYVNLEPCCHYGRTPPCTEAIIAAGIRRVICAMEDPNPRVSGKGIARLRQAGIEVITGVMDAEARKLNEAFCRFITDGRPFTIIKAAMSLDGKIACGSGDSKWISGEQGRMLVHEWRHEVDAVMVGIGTVLADDPRLTARLPGNKGRQPLRVIVDSRSRTPVNAAVLDQTLGTPPLIAVTEDAPDARVRVLISAGAEVLVLPREKSGVRLSALLAELGRRGIMSVMVEGGGSLNAGLLKDGLVDKVRIFIAPKLIGGRNAITWLEGEDIASMMDARTVRIDACRQVGQDLLVEAYI